MQPIIKSSTTRTIELSLRYVPFALLLLGFMARLLPVFIDRYLYYRFPIDDGYYMFTMARNVALGHGISVANGEVLTNGTQPLVTYLWALLYWLCDSDKTTGIVLIHLAQIMLCCFAAYFLFLLGKRVLPESTDRPLVSLWVAALWFSGPELVDHSMNGLETGAIAFGVLFFFLRYESVTSRALEDQTVFQWVCLGLILGVLFWIRNDAALLAVSVALVRLIILVGSEQKSTLFLQAVTIGTVSGGMAVPWMWFNYVGFGYLMPISGVAESLMRTDSFASVLPAVHALATSIYAIIPGHRVYTWRDTEIWLTLLAMLLPLMAVFYTTYRKTWPDGWINISKVWSIYAVLVFIFYALFFGASWFIPRYFYPLTPYAALLIAGLLIHLRARLGCSGVIKSATALISAVVAVFLFGYVSLEHMKLFRNGTSHVHRQLSDWTQENVPDNVWVASWQSGIVGYFHDLTVNLDGKVNPAALKANLNDTKAAYIQQSRAQYIIDWHKHVMSEKLLAQTTPAFEVIVDDKKNNFAVMRRR